MRVLLNTKPSLLYNKTGVGYYVFSLYRELLKSGIDVIPTLDAESKTLIGSLSKMSSLPRKILGEWYSTFAQRMGDLLISLLSSEKASFDIYHETSLDPMPDTGTRSICTVYDLSFFSCPELLPEDFVRRARSDMSRNISIADRIIVISDFVRDEVMRFIDIPEEKIDVIPLAAAAIPAGHEVNVSKAVSRKSAAKDYILYVGTIDPRKNLKTLIRAFREINLKYGIALVIAGGSGWRYEDILSYPEELGIRDDVIFTGYVDEKTLQGLYDNALAFVYPSLYEGFGLPPLEAMACGVPVVISAIPSLVEVAGDAALFFSPQDHKELADKLSLLLSSATLRRQQRAKGLARASEYSWEKVAASTIQTYRRALER